MLDPSQQKILTQITELAKLHLPYELTLGQAITLKSRSVLAPQITEQIRALALALRPWRKGPFLIDELFIDAEWKSWMKFDLLRPHLTGLSGARVADVGCNNAYYLLRLLEFAPARLVGFDPSARCFLQFLLIQALAGEAAGIDLYRLGVEDLPGWVRGRSKFDAILCLGVLYHRPDPLAALRNLRAGLAPGGTAFLDTLYLEGEGELALIPRKTYSRISNIYFILTISALRNLCERAGFVGFELLATSRTTPDEQRRTQWSEGYSLADFLDPADASLTCEGYPAPRRVYVKVQNGKA